MFWRALCATLLVAALLAGFPAGARDPSCPFREEGAAWLNSERIERCFGSYSIELLAPVEGLRVARLSGGTGAERSWQTVALTRFEPTPPAELDEAMQRIREGESIGATLEALGWRVRKASIARQEVTPGANLRSWAGTATGMPTRPVAMYAYRLVAHRGERSHPLAHIAEFYHPAYLSLADLEVLHAPPPPASPVDHEFLAQVLALAGGER